VSGSSRLKLVLAIGVGILAGEVAGGLLSRSLALLSDAAHVATDVLSLLLALFALRLADRPPEPPMTYGWHRAEVLAAFVNSLALIGVCFWLAFEAARRLVSPPEITVGVMALVAGAGLSGNGVMAWLLHHERGIAIRSAYLHILSDLLSSVAVLMGALSIWLFGWRVVDPLLTFLIVALVLRGAWRMARESLEILMEKAPSDTDLDALRRRLAEIPGVREVHDLHVWSISPGYRALTAHLVVNDQSLSKARNIANEVRKVALTEFGLSHVTVELECEPSCPHPPLHGPSRGE